MNDHDVLARMAAHCWINIGEWGDRTCDELHRRQREGTGGCLTCSVMQAGERHLREQLTERNAPTTAQIASRSHADVAIVFRVGAARCSLPAAACREVTLPSPVRRIPHRSDDVVLGIVNVHGDLHVCVSLHALLGTAPPDRPEPPAHYLVVDHDRATCVWPVDHIEGILAGAALDGVTPLEPASLFDSIARRLQ